MPQVIGVRYNPCPAPARSSWIMLPRRTKIGSVELRPTSSEVIVVDSRNIPLDAEQLLLSVHLTARYDMDVRPPALRTTSPNSSPTLSRRPTPIERAANDASVDEDSCQFRLTAVRAEQVCAGVEAFHSSFIGTLPRSLLAKQQEKCEHLPRVAIGPESSAQSRTVQVSLRGVAAEDISGLATVAYRSDTLWLPLSGRRAILIENVSRAARGRVSVEAIAYLPRPTQTSSCASLSASPLESPSPAGSATPTSDSSRSLSNSPLIHVRAKGIALPTASSVSSSTFEIDSLDSLV